MSSEEAAIATAPASAVDTRRSSMAVSMATAEWLVPLNQLRGLYLSELGDEDVAWTSLPAAISSVVDHTSAETPSTTQHTQQQEEQPQSQSRTRPQAQSRSRPQQGHSSSPSFVTMPMYMSSSSSSSAQSLASMHLSGRGRHPLAGPSTMPLQNSPLRHSASPSGLGVAFSTYCHRNRPADAYPPVRRLHRMHRKRILVTGGAGFLGSHLVDRLLLVGHDVVVMDNYFTGDKSNLAHWIGHPNFELVRHDVVNPMMVEVDQIYHLACPASPQYYQANQIKTLKTNFTGTLNLLGLAKRTKARFLLASTSEVYGDPEVTPQKETYNGNVNQTGPRACYDEGKRVAETITYGYLYQDEVDVRVARIFNTYGPRMNPFDGRVVSNILIQALKGEPVTIYGDGTQTRSFCFIHDLIDGLIALMNVEKGQLCSVVDKKDASLTDTFDVHAPINLGTDKEFTILELVDVIVDVVSQLCESDVFLQELAEAEDIDYSPDAIRDKIEYRPFPVDDPKQRRPDISRARELLQWEPAWPLRDGILEMARYYVQQMKAGLL